MAGLFRLLPEVNYTIINVSMKKKISSLDEGGVTLLELVISLAVLAIVSVSMFSLYTNLIHGMFIAKQKAIATTLATNQMEYLKGLSYDSLAVSGGSIYSTNPLPASKTETLNNIPYTIRTSINYVDDAYDGCASYPTQAIKEIYCRSYPPPSGSPSVDTNPQDYKIVNVKVRDKFNKVLAEVDTQIAARVAETSSTTGAMLVTILDDNGNPVSGATVTVANSTIVPAVNLSDTTDINGVAIFYGLPPDTNNDYLITGSATGYSTLSTIKPSGSLQPTYPSLNIVTQQSSSVTLTLKKQGANSLLLEAVDTNGNPLANMRINVKGGYKSYTSPTDTTYYFNNASPDTRPTTDATGQTAISNLVPGNYIFCGDLGATSCTIGGTTYYLVGVLPYGGSNSFYPATVPIYDPANPPSTTYAFGGNNYLQKVRLMFSANANHPRVHSVTPSTIELSTTPLTSYAFQVKGASLPCGSTPASCSTTVRFTQASNTYTASCTGGTGTTLDCTVNLTGITTGYLNTIVTANGLTLTTPATGPPKGGISVSP